MYYLFKLNQFKIKQNRIIRIMPTEKKILKNKTVAFLNTF